MVQLWPGRRVKVRHVISGNIVPGTLTETDGDALTVLLDSTISYQPGDEIELEVPQAEDALYIFHGDLLEDIMGNILTVKVKEEPIRCQRRNSKRIPANLQASYTLLSEKDEALRSARGEILDISKNGALVSADKPLKLNSAIMLTFEFRKDAVKAFTTSLMGEVVRLHSNRSPGKNIYGVEFQRNFEFAEA
jgi:c-di-GMP-binding flagellar brake protein YcgR